MPAPGYRLQAGSVWVEVYGQARLPTRSGEFIASVFRNSKDDREHIALSRGALRHADKVAVRLHSECLTGDTLGSLRCDCREQLDAAMHILGHSEMGLLLYMRQEGRGIGLGNKLRAYALQEQGLDTVEANHHLGFDDDLRDYEVAALMLRSFAIRSIQLFTNNPRKIFALRAHGIYVAGRTALVAPQNPHNAHYMATKAKKSGHILPQP